MTRSPSQPFGCGRPSGDITLLSALACLRACDSALVLRYRVLAHVSDIRPSMREALFKSNVGLGLYKEAEECAFRGPQGAYNDHTDTYNRLC